MSAKKNAVTTPLHLLQNLSQSLLEHLENACTGALIDAEKLLAKLEKQRGKGQDLLHTARVKLQDATVAGKAKSQAKSKLLIADLEALLDGLQERQAETRAYIAQLKRDAQESLKLAQGIGKVKEAVTKVLTARSAKPAAVVKPVAKPAVKVASKTAAPTKVAAAKPAARKAPAKPAAKATVVAKPVAAKAAAAKPAAKAPVSKVVAKPAAKPAVKAAAKSVAKPAVKAPAKAVAKPAPKPAAKAPAKPAASKPVVSAAAAPASGNGVTAPVTSAS